MLGGDTPATRRTRRRAAASTARRTPSAPPRRPRRSRGSSSGVTSTTSRSSRAAAARPPPPAGGSGRRRRRAQPRADDRRARELEPLWRMCRGGVRTSEVCAGAGERASFFPPDPGAAEQSQIGGNVATNAGGPHAFKYGVTGVGDRDRGRGAAGGRDQPRRRDPKDVAGYDVKSLLIGSEGTLGVITAAWLLLPAPEARLPVVAFHRDPTDGCAAIERAGTGLQPAALEYLDGRTLRGRHSPAGCRRAPGSWCCRRPTARRPRLERSRTSSARRSATARWDPHPALTTRCRRAVAARRRLDRGHGAAGRGRARTSSSRSTRPRGDRGDGRDGRRHELEAAAGGTRVTATCTDVPRRARRRRGARARPVGRRGAVRAALRLGGSVSGEHGIGWVKQSGLALQSTEATRSLHEEIKRAFDPKGLLNREEAARIPSPGTRSEDPTRP